MPIIRRRCNANISASVQAQVFAHLISQPRIERANPLGSPLRAYTAEELHRRGKLSDDCMSDAHRVVKFEVIAAARLITLQVERGLKTNVPPRNIKCIGNPQASFDRAVPDVLLTQWQL